MESKFPKFRSPLSPTRAMSLPLVVASILLSGWCDAKGAELRTSAGERPVYRNVSAYRPVAPSYSDGPYAGDYHESSDDCCEGPSCGCSQCCPLSSGYWVDADFLLGWRHGIRFPPAATSAVGVPAVAVAGVLNDPSTVLVYPTEAIGDQSRPGGRVAAGMWLDNWQCWGIEARYWMLADQATNFGLTSTGNPILARPFFDTVGGAPASLLIAYPGIATPGGVAVTTNSELMGGDALLRRTVFRSGCGTLQLLLGYQFTRVNESLSISDLTTDADPANLIADGTTIAINDNFITKNEFHAATIGAAASFDRGDWSIDVLAKVGLGNMKESATISGLTVVTPPGGAAVTNQFGLLTQGANLGTFSQDTFAVSPELNVKFVYHVTTCCDVTAGYTFIYWSDLAQPGNQVDPDLNVPALAFAIRDGEYWMHAITLGATMRF